MARLTKWQLVQRIYNDGPFASRAEAEEAMCAVFDAVSRELDHGNTVHIPGFGVFTPHFGRTEFRLPNGRRIERSMAEAVTARFRPAKGLLRRLRHPSA